MNIAFKSTICDCRAIETFPARLKVGDYLVGKRETYKVVTVQPNCPMWESKSKVFTNVLVEREDGKLIPLPRFNNGQKIEAFRPRRTR